MGLAWSTREHTLTIHARRCERRTRLAGGGDVLGQECAYPGASAVQQDALVGRRNRQPLTHVLGAATLHVAQYDDGSLRRWQAGDGRFESLAHFGPQDNVIGRSCSDA